MDIGKIVLILFVIVAVIAVFLVVFRDEDAKATAKKRRQKNLSAAKTAAKPLAAARRFATMQQYEVIAPARLAKNGAFADLDFILVGVFGLLCVKCIGLGGEVYGNAEDAKWLQVLVDERIPFDNPLQAAGADTRLVRDTLFAAKLKSIPVETVCIFTNPDASLAIPHSAGYYTVKEFKTLLGKDRLTVDKKVDIAKAVAAVKAYLAPNA
ncbi:MAG: nuclease-related domain-containing protein [Ruthenibacterium sp.]